MHGNRPSTSIVDVAFRASGARSILPDPKESSFRNEVSSNSERNRNDTDRSFMGNKRPSPAKNVSIGLEATRSIAQKTRAQSISDRSN